MIRIPKHRPPTHPGDVLLEEFLNPLGVSQVEFAERIGVSFQRLNAIVNGRRGITPDTALRLERALGMEAQFWLSLQQAWELYEVQHSPMARELNRIRRLTPLTNIAITADTHANA